MGVSTLGASSRCAEVDGERASPRASLSSAICQAMPRAVMLQQATLSPESRDEPYGIAPTRRGSWQPVFLSQ
eukprot:2050669-Alexandrium_andersonii.AAC.1